MWISIELIIEDHINVGTGPELHYHHLSFNSDLKGRIPRNTLNIFIDNWIDFCIFELNYICEISLKYCCTYWEVKEKHHQKFTSSSMQVRQHYVNISICISKNKTLPKSQHCSLHLCYFNESNKASRFTSMLSVFSFSSAQTIMCITWWPTAAHHENWLQ